MEALRISVFEVLEIHEMLFDLCCKVVSITCGTYYNWVSALTYRTVNHPMERSHSSLKCHASPINQ